MIDRDYSSIVLIWPIPIKHTNNTNITIVYELQIYDHLCDVWKTLSSTIQSNTVKKNNLIDSIGYRFRIRFRLKNEGTEWSSFSSSSEEYYVLSPKFQMMNPPNLCKSDDTSITLQWETIQNATGYVLRYRDNQEQFKWIKIPNIIQANTVRKKGLSANKSYYFSIMPIIDEADSINNESIAPIISQNNNWSFSMSSDPFTVTLLSAFIQNLLPMEMLSKSNKIDHHSTIITSSTSSLLCNVKCIALYFSAHWCGPCRQFTPILQDLYKTSKLNNKSFEVIFCSADHDQNGFDSYYSSMPWIAIKFDDILRESIMAKFKVSGIPRLCILDAMSGRVIVDNAVGTPFTLSTIDDWIARCDK